uniref:SDR family oxidoreductase n=1 Tax=Thaumasiovibrio occultus TaxID=1891184 RepID=UPI00192D0AEA|nr:SDR family oxidoreductase [Thaumasiovibrio occultus]
MKKGAVLITGGTAGIGLAAAKALVASGHRVLITGRNEDKLTQVKSTLDVDTFRCDSANIEDIHALTEQLKAQDIVLDGLVLNAGVFFPERIEGISAENLAQTLNTNFVGPTFMVQSLLPLLNNPSSVVLVSSVVIEKAFEGAGIYSASKAALEALGRVLNVELAAKGVRINSVRPGVTLTEIQSKAGMSDEQIAALSEQMKHTPMQRILTPDDIVPAITFLLSEGSLGMRNTPITVDGGLAL